MEDSRAKIVDTIDAIVSNGVWYNSSYGHSGLYYENNSCILVEYYPFANFDHRRVAIPRQLQPLSSDRRLILDSKFESSQEGADSIPQVGGIHCDLGRSEYLQGSK